MLILFFWLSPSAHEEEDQGFGMAFSGPDDALQLHNEEYQRRIELEAEERKLEETLEYQRRIENEAKQKHLAEQHKRTFDPVSEKTESFEMLEAYWKHSDDDKYANEQVTNRKVNLLSWNFTCPESLLDSILLMIHLKKNGCL